MASTSLASPPPPQPPNQEAAQQESRQEQADEHENAVEAREAYEYWGYLFKPDKTGTDKLKSLLRSLKDLINDHYEPSDNPDLTPNQLAHFYRDLNGNYDQLFMGTPSESIAFIYKSLGCLHSLQPLHHTHQTAFTDPTVPALKTEGWIMWQTIQVLLGPEEHSAFLREAVSKWDVHDHDTGLIFPKVLPRECFPLEPDKHMVAWYEGVSERLRREAEDQERTKRIEYDHDQEPRRLHDRTQLAPRREEGSLTDEEGSVDSRGPALAYFRNPLYRHVDGRPGITRRSSKRPTISPRPTMLDKGKESLSAFGRIARNVGSPHLWDPQKSNSRNNSRDQFGRRKSHPDSHLHNAQTPDDGMPPTSAVAYDSRFSPREHSSHSHHSSHNSRRRSSQMDRSDRAGSQVFADDEDDGDGGPVYSPPSGSNSSKRRHRHSTPTTRDGDQSLRHSRSHDPTPNQAEGEDYFTGYDHSSRRRNSVHDRPNSPSHPGMGPSFGPSASPLFASTLPKHSGPPPPSFQQRPPSGLPPPGPEPYQGGPPLRNPSIRKARDHGRYDSRSPEPRPTRDPRYGSPRAGRYDNGPAPYANGPPPTGSGPYQGGPPMGARYDHGPVPPRDPRDSRDSRDSQDPRDFRDSRYPPENGPMPPRDPRDFPSGHDSRDARDRHGRRGSVGDRRSARMSGSELDDYSGEDRRHGRPKQTRFAETGVKGRRYPDESPYGRGS